MTTIVTDHILRPSGVSSPRRRIDGVFAAVVAVIASVAMVSSNPSMAVAGVAGLGAPFDASFAASAAVPGVATLSVQGLPSQVSRIRASADGGVFIALSAVDPDSSTRDHWTVAKLTSTGALDPSFASAGPTPGMLSLPVDEITELAVDRNGRLIVIARNLVARILPTGVLDVSFGTFAAPAPVPGFVSVGRRVANAVVLADDSILLGTIGTYNPGGSTGMGIVKLTPGGVIDTSFNASGTTPGYVEEPDLGAGRVFAGLNGAVYLVGESSPPKLYRFTANGTSDPTFGHGTGLVVSNIGTVDETVLSVEQVGGGFAVELHPKVGGTRSRFVKITADGLADLTFGNSAVLDTSWLPSWAYTTIRAQPDGRMLVIFPHGNGRGIARLTSSGMLDGSFNPGSPTPGWIDVERVTVGVSEARRVSDVEPLADGRVLAAGESGTLVSGSVPGTSVVEVYKTLAFAGSPVPIPFAPAAPVPPPVPPTLPPGPGGLAGISPYRAFDSGPGGVCAGVSRSVTVTGVPGVPASGVGSVVINLTVDQPTEAGYLRVWPSGTPEPSTSSINFVRNQTIANTVLAKVGTDGAVAVSNYNGCARVVIDVTGWTAASATDTGLVGVAPYRVSDTGPGGLCHHDNFGLKTALRVVGVGGVPIGGFDSVVINLTVDRPTEAGYVRVWEYGKPEPGTSSINFAKGQTVANTVVVKLGPLGNLDMSIYNGCARVVVDIIGWSSAGASGAGALSGVPPYRVFDSGVGGLCAAAPRSVKVTGVGGVPVNGVGSVLVNLTVDQPTEAGYIRVWPTGGPEPATSSINFIRDQTIANTVVAKVGSDGTITLSNYNGCARVVLDVSGWTSSG